MTKRLVAVALVCLQGCMQDAEDPPPGSCTMTDVVLDAAATLTPVTVTVPSGATANHTITVTMPVMNRSNVALDVTAATVSYSPGGSFTLTPGAASLQATEIAAGESGSVVITQEITVGSPPGTFGSNGWIVEVALTTTCGVVTSPLVEQLTGQIP